MPQKVFVLDTSILCCLLSVPGKDTCGAEGNRWDRQRVEAALASEPSATLVLPLASIIETGNHISQAPGDRYAVATQFADHLRRTAEGNSPWAAFTDQSALWSAEKIIALANTWPALAAARTSMGDATIKDVAEYYAAAGFVVEILTGDDGLKAYEPVVQVVNPRRRQ